MGRRMTDSPVSGGHSGGREVYAGDEYLTRNPDWHVEDSAWKADRVQQMLARHHVDPHYLVEVGCGAGEVLVELAQRLGPECELVGYEIAPAAFEICKPKETNSVRFELADFLEVPTTSRRPDVVLLLDVIEHVEDIFGFLREIRQRSDLFVFHIPLDTNAQAIIRNGRSLEPRLHYGHIHSFTRDIALAQLEDTGFEVIDDEYTPHWRGLEPASKKAALALWPRKLMYAIAPDLAVRTLGGASLLVLAR